MKTMLASGQVSLAGAMAGLVYATQDPLAGGNEGGYGTTSGLDHVVKAKISEVVRPFFKKFDRSGDGHLDKGEIKARPRRPAVLRRLHAIDATRVHLTMTWVVSLSILRPFGPNRDAPRRWDLENGVINRRLQAEKDEKDRCGGGVLPSSSMASRGLGTRCCFERARTARPRRRGVSMASRMHHRGYSRASRR